MRGAKASPTKCARRIAGKCLANSGPARAASRYSFRKSAGSLAMFAAIRRASSRVNNFAADSATQVVMAVRLERPRAEANHEDGFTRKLKPYFSKTDFAVCVRKNDKYCTAFDLAFAVNATG
jgi:hypothetical protein